MILKPLPDIVEADLLSLIDQEREEGPQLDFKRDLPKDDRDGKKAFYADVCAFANTSGGDLVYGIEERDGIAAKLVPQAIHGSVDGYVLKLTSQIRDGIEPTIYGLQIQPVSLTDGQHALVIRVPRSFSGIHRSRLDGHFYVRKSRSNERLDVPGLVSRVADHLGREDRVTSFFARRYADILSNEHPLALAPGPKLVVHLLPARDFLSGEEVDLAAIPAGMQVYLRSVSAGRAPRNTVDGKAFFSADEGAASFFTLFMRSGVVESCADIIASHLPKEHQEVNLHWIESSVLDFLNSFQKSSLAALTTGFPFLVRVALLGTNGLPFSSGAGYEHSRIPNGLPVRQPHSVLILPEILIEGTDADLAHEMHGAFLRMWHAWAFATCLFYDLKGGVWTRRASS